MICEQGDIVSLNFNPSHGHEPASRHYAIVLSPWRVNNMCTLTLLAPVTSVDNGYPLHVRIADDNPIHGFVQCEAIRAMDLEARGNINSVERVGAVDDETLSEVLAHVLIVLGLEDQ